MKTTPKLSVGDLQSASEDLARNALTLHPNLPPAQLVDKIADLADSEVRSEIEQFLWTQYFLRTIRRVRFQERPVPAPLFHYAPIQEASSHLPAKLKLGGPHFPARIS